MIKSPLKWKTTTKRWEFFFSCSLNNFHIIADPWTVCVFILHWSAVSGKWRIDICYFFFCFTPLHIKLNALFQLCMNFWVILLNCFGKFKWVEKYKSGPNLISDMRKKGEFYFLISNACVWYLFIYLFMYS